jgi:hypothetical protein
MGGDNFKANHFETDNENYLYNIHIIFIGIIIDITISGLARIRTGDLHHVKVAS